MTSEEYDKLTDEEKRIKVAELHHPHERWEPVVHEIHQIKWKRNGCLTTDKPRDYLNDLNAMHEAEKLLGPDGTYVEHASKKAAKYSKWLGKIIGWGIEHAWDATAAQRAKAFVLTMENA